MIKPKFLILFLVAASLLVAPVISFADTSASASASYSIRQIAAGTYVLSGTGLDTVAGIQLTVMYDAKRLSSPVVSTTGGILANALTQHNPNIPGTIRFAAVQGSSLPASGDLATISFTGSGTGGSVWVISPQSFTPSGQNVASTTDTTPPASTGSDSSANDTGSNGTPYTPTGGSTTTSQSGGTTTAGIGGVIAGSVTLPTTPSTDDTGSKPKEQVAPAGQQPEQQVASNPPSAPADSGAAAPEPHSKHDAAAEKAPEPAPLSVPSVLERFRLYQGERSPKNLIALFDRKAVPNFVQTPAVAIADGKQTVRVTISKVRGERAPNFAFRSVKYVSVSKVGDGEWEIEVRPDKGATQASISVLVDGVAQELPLAVAPVARVDLIKPGTVTEADFQRFLKERGTPSAPEHDLNNDGKRDYVDDYIFTANYLVEQAAKEKAPAKSTAGK